MSVWCSGRGGFARGSNQNCIWTGSNHGNRGAPRLYAKNARLATGTGGWLAGGVSPIKKVFSVYFRFFSADPGNSSAGG
jgi:hypothetical protein